MRPVSDFEFCLWMFIGGMIGNAIGLSTCIPFIWWMNRKQRLRD